MGSKSYHSINLINYRFQFNIITIKNEVSPCKEQCQVHAGEEDHARPGWTTSIRGQDSPWKSQSEWQRAEINGESASIVWPTHVSRTAKEQKRTEHKVPLQIIIFIFSALTVGGFIIDRRYKLTNTWDSHCRCRSTGLCSGHHSQRVLTDTQWQRRHQTVSTQADIAAATQQCPATCSSLAACEGRWLYSWFLLTTDN